MVAISSRKIENESGYKTEPHFFFDEIMNGEKIMSDFECQDQKLNLNVF